MRHRPPVLQEGSVACITYLEEYLSKSFRGRSISLLFALVSFVVISAPGVRGSDNRVEFDLTDDPGSWYRSTAGAIGGTKSLAVAAPGVEVRFSGRSHTVHTMSSLLYPSNAAGMPFDTDARKGSASLVLRTPGLYVFVCKIHPYMLGAVIVDDPKTQGLDLGENITLVNGITVPTSSDLATRLLRTFFIATNPSNWQNFASSAVWHVTYPDVNVRITGGAVVNLPAVLNQRYGNDVPLPPLFKPAVPAVGEVWVDTQFERTGGKEKPGTASRVDGRMWNVIRKVALPSINMNNPHNMWTDRSQRLIYQTEWFDSKLTVFERETGRFVRQISVGEAPAHVMTRTDTDQVHVSVNGEESPQAVVELSPLATSVERKIDIGRGHPHAHWMSHDGKTMVTPNVFSGDSSIYDFPSNRTVGVIPTGSHAIATGMMPDASKYYVANFLDNTITVIETHTGNVLGTIDLLKNYDPISGRITGPVGGLPIQTPVSPDGKYMVTANTLTATIVITDTKSDQLVAMLPGEPGAHGVQFGAKKGGGYYAYVANKFANVLTVVDADPNADGNFGDATIAGRVLLTANAATVSDDRVVGYPGMGGQGVLAIPVPYNGWVQQLPQSWKDQLTATQINPIGPVK
jgi:DNA-binding beta-propeller fold protein YncE